MRGRAARRILKQLTGVAHTRQNSLMIARSRRLMRQPLIRPFGPPSPARGEGSAPDRRRALTGILIIFIARCLLVMLFLPLSALDKVLNFEQAVGQASQATPAKSLATILIFGGLGVEVFMSLAILTGIADRLAALILAGYCVVTAMLWKPFWRTSDFRLRGVSRGREMV